MTRAFASCGRESSYFATECAPRRRQADRAGALTSMRRENKQGWGGVNCAHVAPAAQYLIPFATAPHQRIQSLPMVLAQIFHKIARLSAHSRNTSVTMDGSARVSPPRCCSLTIEYLSLSLKR